MDEWKKDHNNAYLAPNVGEEEALVALHRGLLLYEAAYKRRFDSQIGSDYVLGPEWFAIAKGLLGLLNGVSGRLDCGTLDKSIREVTESAGFEGDI